MSDETIILPDEIADEDWMHDAYRAYAENVGAEYANYDDFMESYSGDWSSEREFAEETAVDTIEGLNDQESVLARYFDYDAWERDLFMGDYYSVKSSLGCYVFRNI